MGFIEKTRQLFKSVSQQPPRTLPSFQKKQPTNRERKYDRSEFRGLLKGAWKGTQIPQQERIGLEKNLFPWGKYGSKISERDIKSVLQKLRRDEYWTKGLKEKTRLGKYRKTLEKATGFKGKY